MVGVSLEGFRTTVLPATSAATVSPPGWPAGNSTRNNPPTPSGRYTSSSLSPGSWTTGWGRPGAASRARSTRRNRSPPRRPPRLNPGLASLVDSQASIPACGGAGCRRRGAVLPRGSATGTRLHSGRTKTRPPPPGGASSGVALWWTPTISRAAKGPAIQSSVRSVLSRRRSIVSYSRELRAHLGTGALHGCAVLRP